MAPGPASRSTLRAALRYALPYRRDLGLVLGISLSSTALSLYVPLLSRDLVDQALLGRNPASLLRIVFLFVAMTAAGFGLNVVSGLRYTRASARILFDMRLDVYRHLQRLSPRYYARTRLGDIVSRINSDVGEVQRVAAEALLASVGNLLFLFGGIFMLFVLDLRLALLSLAFLPPSVWLLLRYRRRLAGRVAVFRQSSADIGSFLIETLLGMKLVVVSNAQQREVERFQARNDEFVRSLLSMQRVTYLAGGLPGLVLAGSAACVFLAGGSRVIAGSLTLGSFVAFMAYQMRLLAPVQALLGLYASLATAAVSLGRVREILETPPDVVERPDAPPSGRVRGDVAFENVTLRFDRGTAVLDGVSFHVRPGEVLALVGPSGSGKSTIAELLLRLIDPESGVVRLDGHDLRSLRLADLRRAVVLVEQEPFLFHASIAENLRYGRSQASDAELRAAARAVGIDAFIESLPEAYQTLVGERGRALSAGERQRIAIARALLADPAVLVLDEPSAALDPGSEAQVVAGYEAIMKGRTTLLISHRLRLASRADRVVVLDGAKVVEEGPPETLLERRGAFASLFRE